MDSEAPGILLTILAFVGGFSLLVFIHEWGHYSVARFFKVRVDSFSIGFGKELIGYTDKNNTRWKFCVLPLGGYVKFFGDASAASNPGEMAEHLTAAEKADCLHYKPLHQRALIVFAGPAINLIAGALVFAAFFFNYGATVTEPVIAKVTEDSAAYAAGVLAGDRIVAVKGEDIETFSDIGPIVRLYPGRKINLVVERNYENISLPVTLGIGYMEDRFGNQYPYGVLGVQSEPGERVSLGPIDALAYGVDQTGMLISSIFVTTGQMILGTRSVKEIGGPVRIVTMTGEAANQGLENLIWFLALISINLGVINLLPIPVLDGGHLAFYAIEAVKGSPLSKKAQEVSFVAGMALMLFFMLFVTLNDLQSIAL